MNTSKIMNECNIDKEYKRITEAVKGGYIYGIKLDVNNIKHLVVGAYYAGRFDAGDFTNTKRVKLLRNE